MPSGPTSHAVSEELHGRELKQVGGIRFDSRMSVFLRADVKLVVYEGGAWNKNIGPSG